VTFTIAELAAMWKAGERDTVRAAILQHDDPATACEALANLVEFVDETEGEEPALDVARYFTHH
jgi:hypothetical protein